MTLTPKMNIWTEALLACSVACLVLILPSIVADDLMNGTQSGKFFFFIYSLLGILIFWSVGLLFKKELSFHFTIIDLLLALFVGWVSLNKYLLHCQCLNNVTKLYYIMMIANNKKQCKYLLKL